MNGELVLDNALAYTTVGLEESLANQSLSPHLAEYIKNALRWPNHKGMQRVKARLYISFYENDESRNDILLKFAKYDFNRVQMLLQQELSLLSSWWKESNMEARFPFARHRIVESFFVAVALFFEPCYARARSIFAKLLVVIAILDDAYDAYGIYEELQYLTNAMQRFDTSAMDDIPVEYLRILNETMLNVYEEAKQMVHKEGRSYSFSYTVGELKKLVVAYHAQARWAHECYEPTFDEYLEIALQSDASILATVVALMGMEDADENAFKWLVNKNSNVYKALTVLARLYNDIVSNEFEEKRGQVSGTACYMKQNGVSRMEAIEALKERIEVAWKGLNEGCMRPVPVPRQILLRALNLARFLDVAYRNDDGFTKPELSYKHHITIVLIDPIPLS